MKSNNNYIKGILWFLSHILVCVSLDVFQKYLGQNLHCFQITFFRYLFASLILLPIMAFKGEKAFYTSRPNLHIFRGLLLFLGIAIWCYGLTKVHMALATTFNFTIPLFTLPLAAIFLKEHIGKVRLWATLLGFLGVIFIIQPFKAEFNSASLLFLLASFIFASLDTLNKKYVVQEGVLPMLFYTALITMLFGAIPAYFVWQTPSLLQLGVLFLLGCGGSFILFCILKAFQYVDASAVAPYRYCELVFSAIFGFLIFHEVPSITILYGSLFLIVCTLTLAYSESK